MKQATNYLAKLKRNWIYLVAYVFFFYVALRLPIGGDDWEISSWYRGGLLQLIFGAVRSWSYFNGRILHNVATPFFDFYRTMYVIIIPLIIVGNLHLLYEIFKFNRKTIPFIVMIALLLSISKDMRAEVILHMNASIPYNICTFLILLSVYYIINGDTLKKLHFWDSSKLNYITLSILTFSASLWIENLTIGLLVFTVLWCVRDIHLYKKILPMTISAFTGIVIGCIVLFTSVGISNRIGESTSKYGVVHSIINNVTSILNMLVTSQLTIYLIYAIIMLIAIFNKKLKIGNRFLKVIYTLFLCIISVLIILVKFLLIAKNTYYSFSAQLHDTIWDNFFNVYNGRLIPIFISAALIISILIPVIYYKPNKSLSISLYLASFISVVAVIISPGPRNMILAVYCIIGLMGYYISQYEIKNRDLKKILIGLSVITMSLQMEQYIYVLEKAAPIKEIRDRLIEDYKIKSAQGQLSDDECLVLPTFSDDFVGNLNSDYYEPSIKNYYNLRQDAKVIFDDGILAKEITYTSIDETSYVFKVEFYTIANNLYDISQFKYTFWISCNGEYLYVSETSNKSECMFNFSNAGEYIITCRIDNADMTKSKYLDQTLSLKNV